MKHLRKALATAIALFTVVALATPAFASSYKITIKNSADQNHHVSLVGQEFKAYKIFDMTTAADGNSSSYTFVKTSANEWIFNVLKGTSTASPYENYGLKLTLVSGTTTTYTVDNVSFNADNAKQLASDLKAAWDAMDPKPTATKTVTATGESVTIDVGSQGYYLVFGNGVTESDDPTKPGYVTTVHLDNANPTASVEFKEKGPWTNKTITSPATLDEKGQEAVAQIGSKVKYQLTAEVMDMTDLEYFYWAFVDEHSAGLAYDPTSFVLKINGETIQVTDDMWETAATTTGNSFRLRIPFETLKQYDEGDSITLDYACTVLESAFKYEDNTAWGEWSDEQNKEPYVLPKKKTYVVNADIDVFKYTGQEKTPLAGAEFKLAKSSSTAPKTTSKLWYHYDAESKSVTWVAQSAADTFVTDATGHLTTQPVGLAGSETGVAYSLVETKAPNGYSRLTAGQVFRIYTKDTTGADGVNQVTFEYTLGSSTTKYPLTNGVINLTGQGQERATLTLEVENKTGGTLPGTGGIGTTIFYVVGGSMAGLAIVLLVIKKRMSLAQE